jgi:site-specific DNA-methyltransferase (adenine-specific)
MYESMLELNKIYNQDCLEGMKLIDDKSIDMILCDLPYGVTARNKWDSIIPFDKLWAQYERIIKDNGVIVLTATQPFASNLVCSNLNLFKYEWIWEKSNGTGFLNAKKQPLRNHEQVLVFYKSQPIYNPQFTDGKPYTCKQGGHGTNYNDRGNETKEVVTINCGKRYPLTIQKFIKDKEKLHPTQKPLALCEYLIKTYTNENNLVLDNCAGSGTTLLAAKNLNRNFIGFENNEEYFSIACERIS